MVHPQIDFKIHNTLSDNYATKLCLSMLWRELLLQIFPAIIITILAFIWVQGMDDDAKLLFVTQVSVGSYIFFTLITNQYIINSISKKKFKHFVLYLMKNNQVLERMGFYDALCWRSSFFWRHMVVGGLFTAITSGILYLEILPESAMRAVSSGLSIAVLFLVFLWVLKTKKSGRLIILQKREDTMASLA